MHFLFPADFRKPMVPESFFEEQAVALASVGFKYSTFQSRLLSDSSWQFDLPAGEIIVYRGWMLSANEYSSLTDSIVHRGSFPFVSFDQYLTAHHLPRWYPLITDLTPETVVLPTDCDLVEELKQLSWKAFFIKDFVKSLKTSVGSKVTDPAMAQIVVSELKNYRGEIEGGICVRRVEDFITESERRYFVVRGQSFSSTDAMGVPSIVRECADRIPSPFFSVDVILRRDGVERVVEIGDGQVSDLVGWSTERFARIWQDIDLGDRSQQVHQQTD